MPPKIVLLGDSITQMSFQECGWGATLANVYQRRADVLNRGYSGYNTRWIQNVLDDIERDDVLFTVVFFGANDASLPAHNFRQFVPVDEYRENLKRIASGRGKCLFVCPPPVVAEKRLEYQKKRYGDKATGVLERTNENARLYGDACKEVARELGMPCLDSWTLMTNAQGEDRWKDYLDDGLHLSREGNQFLARHLVDLINISFPEFAVKPDPHTGHFGTSGSSSSLAPHGLWHDRIHSASCTSPSC